MVTAGYKDSRTEQVQISPDHSGYERTETNPAKHGGKATEIKKRSLVCPKMMTHKTSWFYAANLKALTHTSNEFTVSSFTMVFPEFTHTQKS
jgi:hypothetical protein